MSLCFNRLQEERSVYRQHEIAHSLTGCCRKQWRRDHPFGFFAKPVRGTNGVLDLKNWEVGIPGKEKTIWEGGLFKLTLSFPDEYPTKPPKCKAHPSHMRKKTVSPASRQIRPPSFPPQRLSVRHRLPFDPERGRRMEAGNHHQADSYWHPRFAQRPKP